VNRPPGRSHHVDVGQADLVDFAAGVADGRLVEIRVGHMVHDEAPAEFLAAVSEFLRRP
jgi:3-oxoadipate enol-lactonase